MFSHKILTKKLPFFHSAFTLVELIVVISVLAVLATIAMTQIGNVTLSARDSQRLTDMSSIKSSIEMYKAKTGILPAPTNGTWVTYSWALLWTQGTFGESTWRQLNNITPKPIDPKYKLEYVYSVANNGVEFELGGIREKIIGINNHFVEETSAASTQNVTVIKWNYNGIFLKVSYGNKIYIVATPTLIGGYLWNGTMETSLLALEWKGSLPLGFSGTVISATDTGTFTPIVAWSGATLPSTTSDLQTLIDGLQNAYSGSKATDIPQISNLLSTSGSAELTYGNGLLANAPGGSAVNITAVPKIFNCSNPQVTTFAGWTRGTANGQWTTAQFYSPSWVTTDSSGNVYVADTNNNLIRKITPGGLVSTLAGSTTLGSTNGQGTAATFNGPSSIAIDSSGNLYVADAYNHLIRKITSTWLVSTFAGSTNGYSEGQGTAAKFSYPYSIAIDTNGVLYVSDSWNYSIRKITPGGLVSTLAGGTQGYTNGQGTSAKFNEPRDLTIDGDGNIYVAEYNNKVVRKITSSGLVSTLAGDGSLGYLDGQGTSAKFRYLYGIARYTDGSLYVSDANQLIRKITSGGLVSTFAGSGGGGFIDGMGSTASFDTLRGMAFDSSDNLYVADGSNNAIRKITCP